VITQHLTEAELEALLFAVGEAVEAADGLDPDELPKDEAAQFNTLTRLHKQLEQEHLRRYGR
jgi:hypothetical protein